MNNPPRNIWVTGASSGLGRSMVVALASRGHRVIASGRNAEALAELEAEHENVVALAFDVGDETELGEVGEKFGKLLPSLDQVILNAGNCEYLDFPEPDWPAVRRVMEVNYFGTLNCLQLALPLLRRSKSGRAHIVCIASQATAAPFPRAEAYGASKAALQYFFNSLRLDLAPENIDVSVVNPGFVDTPLTRKNDFDMPFLMDVDEAAGRIIEAIQSRPRNYSFPRRLSAVLALSKFLPGLWQRIMVSNRQRDTAKTDQP